jgi:hypothetical protein
VSQQVWHDKDPFLLKKLKPQCHKTFDLCLFVYSRLIAQAAKNKHTIQTFYDIGWG